MFYRYILYYIIIFSTGMMKWNHWIHQWMVVNQLKEISLRSLMDELCIPETVILLEKIHPCNPCVRNIYIANTDSYIYKKKHVTYFLFARIANITVLAYFCVYLWNVWKQIIRIQRIWFLNFFPSISWLSQGKISS